jgi:adenosylmethionine-8-amino-7-oxononanoate aminotransferase
MGMGRSGHMFAAEREKVTPDFLCVAKGLTGGYLPLAATLTTERVYEAFLGRPEEGRTFFHGHTYTGNALGCAAALAVFDIFEREKVLEGLPAKIGKLSAELERLRDLPDVGDGGVGDIRQYGLAAGVELVADRASRQAFDTAQRVGTRVCRAAREAGVFLRPLGDVMVIMPPLSIRDDEIERLVDAVEHGILKVLAT